MAKRNPYFRFYPSDFMGGIRGMTAQEVGLYTMLLCRMYEEDGPIDRDDFKLATYCGMREATFTTTLEKLIRLGKIKAASGMIYNDRAEAEISNRANDLEIAIRAGKASAEKRQQNQRQDAATVERPFNHTDTDTDIRKREAKASPKKRGSRLPDDWFLPRDWGQWAVDQGLSDHHVRKEADRFKDWWIAKAGAGGVKLNWEATWRNWIRKHIDDNGKANGNERGSRGAAKLSAFLAGAEVSPPMDFGQDSHASKPLLARR